MSMIIPPPSQHQHDLPDPVREPAPGTLARCATCPAWFRFVYQYQSFGGGYVWGRVRWWHWRLRRRIKTEVMRRTGGPISQSIPEGWQAPSMSLDTLEGEQS